MFILAHYFGGFNLWSVGPIAFGPVKRQHIMEEAAHLMAAGKKGGIGREWIPTILF
jgi:hypothetical protein